MKIAIIGCGYIGLETAKLWKKKGHTITSTTRTPERLDTLSKYSQKALIFKGLDEEEWAPIIADHEALLITIAADDVDQYETAYLRTSEMLKQVALEMNAPRTLIYTSSTSVYGDHHGQWVDESSKLLPDSEQAKILIETEKNYLSLQEIGWHVCILRFAQIYGPKRELSSHIEKLKNNSLAGKGEQYTNMIHKEDCAHAIDYALRHHLQGIYNVADDEHPTRKELYDTVSHQFKLPRVKWDPNLSSIHLNNKRVSNHKIKAEGFVFLHPHREVV